MTGVRFRAACTVVAIAGYLVQIGLIAASGRGLDAVDAVIYLCTAAVWALVALSSYAARRHPSRIVVHIDGKLSEEDLAELRKRFEEAVRTQRPRVIHD